MSSFTPTKVPQMHKSRKERKRGINRKRNQRTHHSHTTKKHPKFPRTPPKFRKKRDCTLQVSHVHKCQVSTYPNLHLEVSHCAIIQGFGLSKTTLQVSTYPTKPPEFPHAHWVWEFLTIQRPNPPPAPPRTGGNPSVCVPKNA